MRKILLLLITVCICSVFTDAQNMQRKQYVSPFNWELALRGMAYKQAKYDANVEKMQNAIDLFYEYLLKKYNPEYALEIMEWALERVNGAYGKADLSDDSIVRNIIRYIPQAEAEYNDKKRKEQALNDK